PKKSPLRVPISILHQQVYSTARRLPSVKRLEVKKPVVVVTNPYQGHWVNGTWVQPEIPYSNIGGYHLRNLAENVADPDEDLFERIPYLRRFFHRFGGHKNIVSCRNCGGVCED